MRLRTAIAVAIVVVASGGAAGYMVASRGVNERPATPEAPASALDLQVAPADGACRADTFLFTGEPDAAGHRSFCLPITQNGSTEEMNK